jgi:hypothetical protein
MGGKQAASRQHVGVAKPIVNNNPETMKLRPWPRPTLEGCGRSVCDVTLAARNKKARERRLARAAWRSFGEYLFLEDSRYASQLKCAARRN